MFPLIFTLSNELECACVCVRAGVCLYLWMCTMCRYDVCDHAHIFAFSLSLSLSLPPSLPPHKAVADAVVMGTVRDGELPDASAATQCTFLNHVFEPPDESWLYFLCSACVSDTMSEAASTSASGPLIGQVFPLRFRCSLYTSALTWSTTAC